MATSSIEDYFALLHELQTSSLEFSRGSAKELRDHARSGSIKLLDALLLRELLRRQEPADMLEVGSFIGFSTRWILESTVGIGTRLTALDPDIPHRLFPRTLDHVRHFCRAHLDRLTNRTAFLPPIRYDELAREIHNKGQWGGSKKDIRARLESIPVVDAPFDMFDFAFVDGDHSYQATWANVSLVARMIRPGGTIVVHDAVTWPRVKPALLDLADATDGAIELQEIAGAALHDTLLPIFQGRMTPQNAKFACNSVSNGMAVVRVHRTLTKKI